MESVIQTTGVSGEKQSRHFAQIVANVKLKFCGI
jgi:hypothetical protein